MRDILAHIEAQILERVNSKQPQYLELYAKYFAQCQNPERISMTEIDSQGFTIQYYEDSQLKEIRATFGSRIVHPNQVDQALYLMAKEAINALDIKADTSYISPGSEIPSVLNSINWTAFIFIVALLSFLVKIRYSTGISHIELSIKQMLRGDDGMDRMFLGIFVIHMIETVFTLAICKFWGDLVWSETILYMILTFIGGIFVLKGAAKRVGQIQRSIKNSKKEN